MINNISIEHDVEFRAHVWREIAKDVRRAGLGHRPEVLIVLSNDALKKARNIAPTHKRGDAIELRTLL